jgi:hypothetical protein
MAVDAGHHVVITSLEKAEPVAWWRGACNKKFITK